MLDFLKNVKIGSRIALALTLPILGLVLFSGFTVVEKMKKSSEMGKILELAELAPVISALVHELQKERGASAGFIGSKGKSFADILPAQRNDTNAKRTALGAALKAFDGSSFGTSLVGKIKTAEAAVAQLGGKRGQITALQISVPQMAGYYTPTIGKLLKIVEEMALLSTDAQVSGAITAYTAFLQGKERAGVERAMGAGGFGAGKFAPAVYRKFLQLIAMQDVFLGRFAIYGTAEQRAFLKSTVTGSDVNEVNRMRKIAIESVVTGNTGGVKGPAWFGAITKKINLLKKVEDRIAADLQGLTKGIEATANTAFVTLGIITLILLAVTAVLVIYIVRGITGPIGGMTEVMRVLAEGDTSREVTGTERGDEIGDMAGAVQVFRENTLRVEKMEVEQKEAENRTAEEKTRLMNEMAETFETSVGGVVKGVASASSQMQSSAQAMSSTAEETSRQSSAVAAAAEQASANVQTVAAASEELSASIAEIGQQVSQASDIAGQAVTDAQKTDEQIQGLAEAASKIGEVVALITDIADQTNLLALNATIEAARAGDAGKGFAVVASEVKTLANQTAKATDEIGGQIGGIQAATRDAVTAIQGIGQTIGQINEIASAIAAAVEQQSAATGEIARNVEQAATGTQEVTTNIAGVNQAADETGSAASEILGASGELSDQADLLKGEVDKFLSEIRAA